MHLATYSKADAGKMLAHYERGIGERDHIDPNGVIYNLAPTFEGGIQKRFRELTDGLEIGAKTRPLADFVVTQPKGYEGDLESLFKAVYSSLAARVGDERIVGAYVHVDEPGARPHMHFSFVPVVETPVMTNDKTKPLLWTKKDEHKNSEHVAGTQKTDSKGTPRWKRVPLLDEDGHPVVRRTASASKMFTKQDMKELHPQIEKEVCAALGVESVGLLLGEEDDAKKLSALGHREFERVTATIERKKVEAQQAAQVAADLNAQADAAAERLEGLQRNIEELEPLAADVHKFADAGRAEQRSILDSIAARCAEATRAIGAAIDELRELIWELTHPRAQGDEEGLDDMLANAQEVAAALGQEHEAPVRPRGQVR